MEIDLCPYPDSGMPVYGQGCLVFREGTLSEK